MIVILWPWFGNNGQKRETPSGQWQSQSYRKLLLSAQAPLKESVDLFV